MQFCLSYLKWKGKNNKKDYSCCFVDVYAFDRFLVGLGWRENRTIKSVRLRQL